MVKNKSYLGWCWSVQLNTRDKLVARPSGCPVPKPLGFEDAIL